MSPVPNGFNSSGLTYGGSVAFTPNAKWSVLENYYGGPVIVGANADGTLTNNAWRHLSDTVITYTMSPKWAFTMNGGRGRGDFTAEEPIVVGCGGLREVHV